MRHQGITSELDEAAKWFSAWEYVSAGIYGRRSFAPVEFVFFDLEHVYSTSRISVPAGEIVSGPRLFQKKLIWRKAVHNGELKLPDGRKVPAGLMSFAAPLGGRGRQAFFVMPLPEFWEKAGVKSEELGLRNLLTGVFLHEFSHSQQIRTYGRKIAEFEQKYKFDTALSDDIVQDHFEKVPDYEAAFREETELFYSAAEVGDDADGLSTARSALTKLRSRHKKYFTADSSHFAGLDELFLTMEGFGQMTMYLWLTDPKGGNIMRDLAKKGVRRGKRSWSQDEGFAMFLLLNKFSKPKNWAGNMLGNKPESVIKILERAFGNARR
ncbi:MAG: hypothetical protein R2681_08445 [Pyrinomonadaceae bacterium]